MATCAYCAEDLPPGAKHCPACLHEPAVAAAVPAEDTYDLGSAEAAQIPDEWQGGAVYTMELPARCPYCREVIRTLRVLKLKRTQATFTSTFPRAGRILVCPACERILSAELAAL